MPRLRLFNLVLLFLLAPPTALMAAEQAAGNPRTIDRLTEEYYLFQAFHAGNRLSLNHLGMLTEPYEDAYRVSAVLDGFPAQLAGLRRGDVLIAVDDIPFHPVQSLNPQIGDSLTTLPLGRTVELTYRRDGEDFTATLQPVFGNLFDAYRTATLNSVQFISNGNKLIGYVKLWSLDRSANGMQTFLQLIEGIDHCDGLILDLRDSYGFIDAGHLDPFFSSRNSYFTLDGNNPDLWQQHQPERRLGPTYGKAIVLIQNNGTRGGIELFSQQLTRLQRVVSVGESTGGMAGQVSYDESDGLLEYTPDHAIRIDGLPLEDQGISAEIPVPYPLTESRPIDPQLDAAMLALMAII